MDIDLGSWCHYLRLPPLLYPHQDGHIHHLCDCFEEEESDASFTLSMRHCDGSCSAR